MQHVQQIDPTAGQHSPLAPLRVATIQPSLRQRLQAQLKDTSLRETLTEMILAMATFSLVGGLLFSLYRALEHYTIIPLP
jgi:hypothetical protein